MTRFKKHKLGDVIDLKRGYDLPQQHRKAGKVPIFSSAGLSGFHCEAKAKGPGVITGRYGTLGELFYTEKDYWPHNTTLYVKDFKGNYPKFIYYFLQTLGFNNQNDKTSVPGLNRNHLHEMNVFIPEDITTQTLIASILSSLDDKIELNRRTNQTLEQIAQTLFKKYFVHDIDPENLPEGWKYAKLGYHIKSISKTHKFPNEEIIFLNTSDILDGKVLHSNYSIVETLPGQAKKSIQRQDILLSEIRPANKRFAFINFDAEDYVVSTKLMVLRPASNIDSLFYYFILTRSEMLAYLQNLAESRSGTFPQITFDQIKDIDFLLPNDEVLDIFVEKTLKPFYAMIFKNEKEIESLSKLRDYLLPKLMSGEIEVNTIEKELSEA